jgi:orotate phosphoribosyltransferase
MTLEQQAIQFFLDNDVLKFGDFTLKSGRKSPYFFNTGSLCTATQLSKMGELYARKLQGTPAFQDATVIFGSAYKGIPIAVSAAVAMAGSKRSDIRAVSDRKEAKTHGDAGNFLGVIKSGDKVVIVDDVITTGGTKFEALEKLREIGCEPLGFIIAFDRAEPMEAGGPTAREAFEQQTGLPVFCLANINDVAAVRPEVREKLEAYLAELA